jgi:hypothetical protein
LAEEQYIARCENIEADYEANAGQITERFKLQQYRLGENSMRHVLKRFVAWESNSGAVENRPKVSSLHTSSFLREQSPDGSLHHVLQVDPTGPDIPWVASRAFLQGLVKPLADPSDGSTCRGNGHPPIPRLGYRS